LRALALHLGLDEFYFDKYIAEGNSILRPIHYHQSLKNQMMRYELQHMETSTYYTSYGSSRERSSGSRITMEIGSMLLQNRMN
jgi:hypothetical protein